jgi:hypothetical protein
MNTGPLRPFLNHFDKDAFLPRPTNSGAGFEAFTRSSPIPLLLAKKQQGRPFAAGIRFFKNTRL